MDKLRIYKALRALHDNEHVIRHELPELSRKNPTAVFSSRLPDKFICFRYMYQATICDKWQMPCIFTAIDSIFEHSSADICKANLTYVIDYGDALDYYFDYVADAATTRINRDKSSYFPITANQYWIFDTTLIAHSKFICVADITIEQLVDIINRNSVAFTQFNAKYKMQEKIKLVDQFG